MATQRYIVMPEIEWVNGRPVPNSRVVLLTAEEAAYDLSVGRIYLDGTQPPAASTPVLFPTDALSVLRDGLSRRIPMTDVVNFLEAQAAGGISMALTKLTFDVGAKVGDILTAIQAPPGWPIIAETTMVGRVAVAGTNLVAAQAVPTAASGTVRLRATSPDGLRVLTETFPIAFGEGGVASGPDFSGFSFASGAVIGTDATRS